MEQSDKDLSIIPSGDYCYRFTGETVRLTQVIGNSGDLLEIAPYLAPKRECCPYWELRENYPEQENGYCRFLGKGDWDLGPISLLWDQIKECGVNLGTANREAE